jgi:peptide-methionine (S)-S-oxide reductase
VTQRVILVAAIVAGLAYGWLRGGFDFTGHTTPAADVAAAHDPDLRLATFAAGCFWCAEADFEKVSGVVAVVSGYTGGHVENPTYEQVSSGGTGHAEAVEVYFDPRLVSYEQLLDRFWHDVDPFAVDRQFCDAGEQYRAEIFVHDAAERAAAEASKRAVEGELGRQVAVPIADAGPFYRAEAHHQDYYKTHPMQYRFYRWSCGRDRRLAEVWGRAH